MSTPERSAKYRLFHADDAWQMFARATSVRFAGVCEGRPVLRTLSAVVSDGAICVHGADDGEKLGLLGPVIASCEEIVAQVASYWVHPELACPASTYYLSAIAEGELKRVDDLDRKAAIMGALMSRFQPEGGYVPLTHDKRYAKVLESLLIAELRPTKLSAKHKLGQHRTKKQAESILEGLWQRGGPGDTRAIRLIRDAHPDAPCFRSGPEQSVLDVSPTVEDARQVARLLEGQYWTGGFSLEQLAQSQLNSDAWIVARLGTEVVASARAVTDGVRLAWIMDVIVHPAKRGLGYGRALMQLLMEHPALRTATRMRLRTRSPEFYGRLGFVKAEPAQDEMSFTR
jgi:nitroimidazol reductase NimA-like FMN-containing flavoprotein (pyridoxamine 5'-phosphate oxidase superfamily)/GNAT superfamily N-acetyltransferase